MLWAKTQDCRSVRFKTGLLMPGRYDQAILYFLEDMAAHDQRDLRQQRFKTSCYNHRHQGSWERVGIHKVKRTARHAGWWEIWQDHYKPEFGSVTTEHLTSFDAGRLQSASSPDCTLINEGIPYSNQYESSTLATYSGCSITFPANQSILRGYRAHGLKTNNCSVPIANPKLCF
jgi:hypothetical protein